MATLSSTTPHHGNSTTGRPEGPSLITTTTKQPSVATTETAADERGWSPSINRRQSWSEQDMKHELQKRLTGLEKGKESGFTEIAKRYRP
jgi:hypothetical protein